MNRQAFTLTIMVILTMTLGGCAGLAKTAADSQPPAGLTTSEVQAMIDDAVARDRAARVADESDVSDRVVSGILQPASQQPAGLTASEVRAMIDEAVKRDRAIRKADESGVSDGEVSGILQNLEAVNLNHPAIALKREVRGCTLQMVLYADTDLEHAADACMRIYRRGSTGKINGSPLVTVTQ